MQYRSQPKPYVYMYKCILNTILNHTLNRIRCLQKRFHETKRLNDFNCFYSCSWTTKSCCWSLVAWRSCVCEQPAGTTQKRRPSLCIMASVYTNHSSNLRDWAFLSNQYLSSLLVCPNSSWTKQNLRCLQLCCWCNQVYIASLSFYLSLRYFFKWKI